jgi:hypothetical protein
MEAIFFLKGISGTLYLTGYQSRRQWGHEEKIAMPKYQFIIESSQENDQVFHGRVFNDLVPRLDKLGPEKLKISISERKPPRISIIPLEKEDIALVSIQANERVARALTGEIAGMRGVKVSGYRVEESMPVPCSQIWKDGEASPGIVLLTLLVKNPRLSTEEFMREWFGRHTPMSLEIHPLATYIRNVVEKMVVPGSPRLEGIVEERFREERDLFNPARMFGGLFKMIPNMVRVGRHVNHFLDLSRLKSYILTEYILKS